MPPSPTSPANQGTSAEVFLVFLKLGLTSFGGPIAHIGYFRDEVVKKRRWVDDAQFGQLLAMCQFLPGPASSQLGFSLGLLRAGWTGALAAFLAFTLPSVAVLMLFASTLPLLSGPLGAAALHGSKLMAAAVVAHALLGMASRLCPDRTRQLIAVITAVVMLLFTSAAAQVWVVALAAMAGVTLLTDRSSTADTTTLVVPYSTQQGSLLLLVFATLLLGLPLLMSSQPTLPSVGAAFFRSGALVFGGGHVVLPLLEETVVDPGWITADEFFAGYAAAQAIPGPMFAFAAYLGARLAPTGHTLVWSMTAVAFIFLPGFLLIAGVLPWWRAVTKAPAVLHGMAGVNAAVVGLLAAALYTPVFTSGVTSAHDMAIVLGSWALLRYGQLPPVLVLSGCLAAAVIPVWLGL